MGVRSLTKFVNEQGLFEEYLLHGGRVVIDGCNLFHSLYHKYNIPHEYGGDYDVFDRCCRSFFEALRKCDVTAYVVFDGAYDADLLKFKKSLDRSQQQIDKLSDPFSSEILPHLVMETFHDVLNDINVAHVTCYLEADEQIAALAQRWRCPVITADSDFFIYDLPGGVINLEKTYLCPENIKSGLGLIQRSVRGEISYYMQAEIYKIDNLIDRFRLAERPMVALAATLLGNDVVDSMKFQCFYNKIVFCAPRDRMLGVFQWLGSTKSLSVAIESVLNCIENVTDRYPVQLVINRSVASYSSPKCNIEDFILNHKLCESSVEPPDLTTSPKSLLGNVLPVWFLENLRSGEIPVQALSVVTLRQTILSSQIELLNEPSAHRCSLRIRACFYSILSTVDSGSREPINEYDRVRKELKPMPVEILRELSSQMKLPDINDIQGLTDDQKCVILGAALFPIRLKNSKVLAEFPPGMDLLIMMIVFWATNAAPKITDLHVKALITCCLCLGALDDMIKGSSAGVEEVKKSLVSQFSSAPIIDRGASFDRTIVHAFSQFQSCFRATLYLQQLLLMSASARHHPSRMLNGCIFYNLVKQLESQPDADAYIEELLGEGSSMAVQYRKAEQAIHQALPENSLKIVPKVGKDADGWEVATSRKKRK